MTNPLKPAAFRLRRICPARLLRLAGDQGLVVIAPHPDDETLGCGSLIARAVASGVKVSVIALTDGDASHPGSERWPPAALARLRRAETRRALARLGAGRTAIRRLGWHDGGVAADAQVLRLRRLLAGLRPGVVLVTSPADHHPDHQAAWRLAERVLRASRTPLATYAVWSRADEAVRPTIDRHRGAKRRAVAAHRSQLGGYISDDPDGFHLSPAVLASLIGGREDYRLSSRPGRARGPDHRAPAARWSP